MPQIEIQREYTVYADENGREYFLIPESGDIVKKVYLDEQEHNNDNSGNNATSEDRQENTVLLTPADTVPDSPNNTVLVAPSNQVPNSPPVHEIQNYDGENDNPDVIFVQSPSHSSGKLDPVQEEEPLNNSNPSVIYVEGDPQDTQTTNEEPDIVYLQQQTPEPEPLVVVLEDPPENRKPKRYNHSTPDSRRQFASTPQQQVSDGRSTTSHSDITRPNRKHPNYKPKPLPEQQAVEMGGMLIVDNDHWEAKPKIDTRNRNYKRNGGNVLIPHENLKWNASPRVDAYNRNYHRGGGDNKIVSEKLSWDGRPRVDHINSSYKRSGGGVLIFHENLKWKKGNQRWKNNPNDPSKPTARSVSSEDVHTEPPITPTDDFPRNPIEQRRQEYQPSYDSKQNNAGQRKSEKLPYHHPDQAKKSSYALKFKGNLNRTKGKDLPPLKEILALTEQDKEKELQANLYQNPSPSTQRPKKYVKAYSPRQNPDDRPAFRLTSKKEVIPPIISEVHEPYIEPVKRSHPVPYVLPQRKTLPWKNKNIEKVSAKTLEDISTTYAKSSQPQLSSRNTYSSSPQNRYPAENPYYNDNYGGNYQQNDYYYNEDLNEHEPQIGSYNYNRKLRENQRHNNKFTSVQNQHHYPTRKRNEPVY